MKMEAQLKLFCLLQIHRDNMHMLHWKSVGRGFENIHVKVTDEYYSKIVADSDDVAEILMRQGASPLNAVEVIKFIYAKDSNVTLVSSQKDYSRDEVIKYVDNILKDIVNALLEVLSSDEVTNKKENIGVKAYYEGLLNEYDKEYRYLNKRRMITTE